MFSTVEKVSGFELQSEDQDASKAKQPKRLYGDTHATSTQLWEVFVHKANLVCEQQQIC